MIKEESRKLSLIKSILLILLSISIAVGGQIILKIGMNRIGFINVNSFQTLGKFFSEVIKSPLVWVGLLLYVLSAAIWLVILSAVDLSFAYPFIGVTYVMVLILSKFILKEDVNPLRWAGAAIITIGVVVISRG